MTETTSDPATVVDRAYELISFAAGGEPQWPEFRALFANPCVLALRVFPDDAAVTIMDLDAYVIHQMREGMGESDYTEIPGRRRIERIGSVASVQQEFTMTFGTGDPVPAIDFFHLAELDGRWSITAILSDMRAD